MRYNSPTLTLCMIVRDEEKNLEQSINSIKPQIDEIIVVDTGSKDKTIQIAKKLGAKVYSFVWDNDFSAARNFALQQATCDWIINLNADHIFECDSRDVLRDCLKNNKYLGLMIEENQLDAAGKDSCTERLLLFKNHCGFVFNGLVYETPLNSINEYARKNEVDVPYSSLKNCRLNRITHVKHDEKLRRKLKLLNSAIKKQPDSFHYVLKKLLTLKSLKRSNEYEKVLLNAIYRLEKNKPHMSESIVGIWGQFGSWILKDNNANDIEQFYNNAKELNTKIKFNDIRLVWPYVKISILQKNYNKAIKDLTTCIKNGIAPANVSIKKEERVATVYQLLKLINEKKSLEEFASFVLSLPVLISKSNLEVKDVLELLKTNDSDLYESVKDLLGQFDEKIVSRSKKRVIGAKKNKIHTVSLCMTIKNEQDNIDRCLKSVKGIVDEIIIVDTGSHDKSIDIALKYGARVIKSQSKNDFSIARNSALSCAKGGWILHLDADEELNLSTKDKIKTIIRNTKVDAFNILLRIHQPENEIIRYIDVHQVRLFRNKPEYRYRGKFNEQIIPSIADSGGAFKESSIFINSYSLISKNENRHKRTIPLYKAGLKTHPKDANLLFELGETYKSLDKWEKAEKCYTEAIRNPNGNISNEIKEIIFLRLAQISLANDKYNNSKKYATACLRFNKENALAKYILAVTYMYLGHNEISIMLFIELKRTQKVHGLDLPDIDAYLETLDNKVENEDKVLN